MDEYKKVVKIVFESDEKSLNDVNASLKALSNAGAISEEDKDALTSQLKDLRQLQAEAKAFQAQITELSQLNTDEAKKAAEVLKEQLKLRNEELRKMGVEVEDDAEPTKMKQLSNIASGAIAGALMAVGKKFLDGLVNVFKDAWSELKNQLQYSLLSNQHTRELAFNYGFTASEAYGWDKAAGMLGISNIEDLAYLNPTQQQKFYEVFQKYSDKYASLYDSGFFDTMLDYQIEMEEFKLDMQMEVIEFFMANKDVIKSGMLAIMELTQFTVQALGWLIEHIGGERQRSSYERSTATQNILNNAVSNARTTNVQIDNTFNNVGRNDQTWLANAGQMTYQQIITALEGN